VFCPQAMLAITVIAKLTGAGLLKCRNWAGVLTYCATREEAVAHVQALALRLIADRLDPGNPDTTYSWRRSLALVE